MKWVGAWRSLVAHLNGVQGQGKKLWPFLYAGFRPNPLFWRDLLPFQELQELRTSRAISVNGGEKSDTKTDTVKQPYFSLPKNMIDYERFSFVTGEKQEADL